MSDQLIQEAGGGMYVSIPADNVNNGGGQGMTVKICGVPYRIEYCDENFSYDEHLGRIIYSEGVIRINKSCTEEMRKEVLYHEIVHGILWHTGQYNMHNDEPLVQALANAIYNMFELKKFVELEEEKQ